MEALKKLVLHSWNLVVHSWNEVLWLLVGEIDLSLRCQSASGGKGRADDVKNTTPPESAFHIAAPIARTITIHSELRVRE